LSDEAERARDAIMSYMVKLDRVASRLDERAVPVGADRELRPAAP
jgi:hypothetical protein